ncbi:MAG: hypothetical protein IJL76_02900 [Bacilli bacterium]|nr:hypothetical protein [Bacilli bacterium]
MKRIFCLLLVILLIGTYKVNALNSDYLTYITTQDTEVSVGSMSASPKIVKLKKGTIFKMAYHAGGENTIILSNGDYADDIKAGTYELKEPFDMKMAHAMDNTDYVVVQKTNVFSDPSAIKKIGTLPKDTNIEATYYYGPYVYVASFDINGWVYTEYITAKDTVGDDDAKYNDNKVKIKEPDNTINKKWIFMASGVSVLIIILIISLVIIARREKNK